MISAEWIKTWKRLGTISLLFASVALIVSMVEKKDASFSTGMEIEIEPLEGGHMLITREDVLVSIDRSFGIKLDGLPLSAIDVERLERVLEEEPFILDANVFIDAQNQINIRVEQREPVLRVMDDNGLNYYLDEAGLKMPLSPHFTTRVLVATGNIPPHVPGFLERERHGLRNLFLLAETIREDPFFAPLFDQVYVNKQGEYTLVPKVGDQKVVLGAYGDLDEKLENLKIFYKEAMPYEGWQKYRTIDLRYKGQVVCKKR